MVLKCAIRNSHNVQSHRGELVNPCGRGCGSIRLPVGCVYLRIGVRVEIRPVRVKSLIRLHKIRLAMQLRGRHVLGTGSHGTVW